METATSAGLIFATGRRRGGNEKTHEGLFHPYLVQRDKDMQRKFKEAKQRHEERQGCEAKPNTVQPYSSSSQWHTIICYRGNQE